MDRSAGGLPPRTATNARLISRSRHRPKTAPRSLGVPSSCPADVDTVGSERAWWPASSRPSAAEPAARWVTCHCLRFGDQHERDENGTGGAVRRRSVFRGRGERKREKVDGVWELPIGRPTSTIWISAPFGLSAAHQLLPPGARRVLRPPLSPQRGPPHFSGRFTGDSGRASSRSTDFADLPAGPVMPGSNSRE